MSAEEEKTTNEEAPDAEEAPEAEESTAHFEPVVSRVKVIVGPCGCAASPFLSIH